MKKCNKCGANNNDDAVFCSNCDTSLNVEDSTVTANRKLSKNKKIVIFVTSLLVGLILIVFIINASILSKRMTFSSKNDMLAFLQGTWTSYDSSGQVQGKLVFDDNTIIVYHYSIRAKMEDNTIKSYWEYTDSDTYENARFSHLKGTFETYGGTYGTYTINSNGKIIQSGNNNIFQKTSSQIISASFPNNKEQGSSSSDSTYEAFLTVLKLTKGTLYEVKIYTKREVTITYNGKTSWRDVSIADSFKTSSEKIVGIISKNLCIDTAEKFGFPHLMKK